MYSKIDYNVVCKQNLSNNNDTGSDNNADDNKNDENGPGHNKRNKLSHIPSSWLLITNEKGFIVGMTITPGIKNINFRIILSIFYTILHIFSINLH